MHSASGEDIEATFSISNFGALIEMDKALYNWTDTVYITITAPDHNNNSAAEETIGTSALPIQVTSRVGKMCTSAQGSAFAIAAETGRRYRSLRDGSGFDRLFT